jgi:hypothetical protein
LLAAAGTAALWDSIWLYRWWRISLAFQRSYNKPTNTPTLSQVFSAISKGAILFIARVTFDRSDISAVTYYSEIEPSFVRAQLDFERNMMIESQSVGFLALIWANGELIMLQC